MDGAFPGLGTLINVVTIVVGSLLGMAVGHRLPERTRSVVTDCLGLTTLLMAGLSALSVTDTSFAAAVGTGAPVLIVLGSLLIGGITGSLLGIEERLEGLAGRIQERLARRPTLVGAEETGQDHRARERFIEGWLSASLLFCVGPLTILGSLSDGLGRGIDQLTLKSVLDGFAAMAFASSFGVGVLLSAGSVLVVQGLLTLARGAARLASCRTRTSPPSPPPAAYARRHLAAVAADQGRAGRRPAPRAARRPAADPARGRPALSPASGSAGPAPLPACLQTRAPPPVRRPAGRRTGCAAGQTSPPR